MFASRCSETSTSMLNRATVITRSFGHLRRSSESGKCRGRNDVQIHQSLPNRLKFVSTPNCDRIGTYGSLSHIRAPRPRVLLVAVPVCCRLLSDCSTRPSEVGDTAVLSVSVV